MSKTTERIHVGYLLAMVCLMAICIGQSAFAQRTISFQGRLTDADGTPVADGTYTLQFQLFNQRSGGAVQWEENHRVETRAGVFSQVLGSTSSIELEEFNERPYLQLIVDGTKLSPRTQFTTVPYAVKSYQLDASALRAGANVEVNSLSDGTIEISASGGGGSGGGGLSSVSSNQTLVGNGTSGSPLSVAPGGITSQELGVGAVTGAKLANGVLVGGQNVTVNRQGDGAWEISATGGGGGGGLTEVTSDATLTGDGTGSSPLQLANGAVTGAKLSNNAVTAAKLADGAVGGSKLADGAVVAGSNVSVTRQGNGSLEISAVGGGTGGLTAVASDATLTGDGTGGDPLQLANGAVTGAKLSNGAVATAKLSNNAVTSGKLSNNAVTAAKVADGAVTGAKLDDGVVVAGANVTVTRQGNGAYEVSSVGGGGGGLTEVSSDVTLSGDGTGGSPLAVSVPLELTGSASGGVVQVISDGGGFASLGDGSSGVYGQHSSGRRGTLGRSDAGVYGSSSFNATANKGALGTENYGVSGQGSGSSIGVRGTSNSGDGIYGSSSGGSGRGVYGQHVSSNNWGALGIANFGGAFNGNVVVIGTLSKSGGSFKIDHPLDPAGKYLSHSFVESPDMMNVYNGNVTTDAAGEATITLPDYFEALNRDFRYQLTAIGAPGPNLYIAEKIAVNQFKIAGGAPGIEVSWQVTGIRQDAWAEENRIVVEEEKTKERGFYLNPSVFGQSQERSIWWGLDPEGMRARQQQDAKMEAERQQIEQSGTQQ